MAKKLKWYKLEAGNSSRGSVGMVIRLQAYSRNEAVEKANAQLDALDTIEGEALIKGVEYCNTYVAGHLTENNIMAYETEDVEPGEEIDQEEKPSNGTGIFVANGDELCIPCGYSHAPGQHHAPVK